jgi:hypothetical protein
VGNSDRIRRDVGLTVRVEQDGEALVIRPVGELDVSTTQTLDAELQGAIKDGTSEVILDLGGLSSSTPVACGYWSLRPRTHRPMETDSACCADRHRLNE